MRLTTVGKKATIAVTQMANNEQLRLVSRKTFMKMMVCLSALFFSFFVVQAQQTAAVGKVVSSVKLIDSKNNPKDIPFFGEKVIVLFYNDPDVKDVNDPLSEALKAKNFSKEKYVGIGIANCKDTWTPNSAIRMMVRKKEKQFPGTVILLDEDLSLAKAWGLGNCDGTSVVVVIGKDSKIKFVKKIKTQEESKLLIPTVVKIIQDELAK